MTFYGKRSRAVVSVMLLALTGGCALVPPQSIVEKAPVTEMPKLQPPLANGSIYQRNSLYQPLFEDRRPRNTGDTLTIVLDEQVSASKSSASNATRKGAVKFTPGLVPTDIKKLSELGLDVESGSDFNGGGGSNARNSFTGTITVTVMDVMANGNLKVRGEKQIGINQGKEFIRFSGYVNPRTITAQNTVPSTQVAEARIEYVGDGYINEAQSMGWGQRLLINLWPF